MRPVRWTLVAITIPFLFGAAAPAAAQRPSEGWVRVAVNPYVGVLFLDDDDLRDPGGVEIDPGPLLGGRLGVALGEDWRFEGAYGWASGTVEESEFVDFPVFDIGDSMDLSIHLFYGAVDYLISSGEAPTRLLLSAGAGFMMIDPEEGESDADFMATLGAGFTHPVNDWITFRGEARDHIVFCAAPERAGEFALCLEDEPLHNFEVSGGLEFWVF
jgi:hypothetical protein